MEPARITVEDLTSVRKRVEVEIAAADVQAELDRAFHLVGQQARLRGFRPGKVPRPVLERNFGEQVRREVLGRLVEESLRHAIEHHRLDPIGTPDIDADAIEPGQGLKYSATLDVRPVIEIGDLGGLKVARGTATVSDEDVERALESLRESVAQLRPVTERVLVESGDIVRVDLESRLEGAEPVKREGVLVEAGVGSFPLALERQLVGQHRGARLSLQVPYPADYPNPGLAGKTAAFEVEIKDLLQKELPPLDDDFARDHARAESLADLRTRVRADLERQAAERVEEAMREELLDQLVGRHQFDVPPSLVDRRTAALLEALDVRLPEQADRNEALARLQEQVRPRAERQVRSELLLDAVATREGIEVSEDEVHAAIDALAARDSRAPERVRGLYHRPEAHAALHAKLVRDRALARLIERSASDSTTRDSTPKDSTTEARTAPDAAAKDIAREK
jgi:trigger factor